MILQLLTNEIGNIGIGTQFSDLPTNQDLESQNLPTSLLTRVNFELTVNRNPAQCR